MQWDTANYNFIVNTFGNDTRLTITALQDASAGDVLPVRISINNPQ